MTYIRKKSQKQEKRTAKEFGGKTQIASGALWTMKADVRTDKYLIENKFTDADFYKLDASTWKKIFEEATRDSNRIPLMQIDIQDTQLIMGSFYDVILSSDVINNISMDWVTPNKSTRILKEWFNNYDIVYLYIQGYELAIIKKEKFLDGDLQT